MKSNNPEKKENPIKENIHSKTETKLSGSNKKTFPCYARTEKRFKPYFTEQTGKEIGQFISTMTDEEGLSYNPDKDCFVLNTHDNQREEYPSELILTDEGPMRLYPIGTMQGFMEGRDTRSAWQWQEVKKSGGSE